MANKTSRDKPLPEESREAAGVLGDKLRAALAAKGWSGQKLAAEMRGRMGAKSASTVNRWIKGDSTPPRIDEIEHLAAILGVPVAYLADSSVRDLAAMGGVESMPKEERALLQRGRELGVERAAAILEAASFLSPNDAITMLRGVEVCGKDLAMSRLFAVPAHSSQELPGGGKDVGPGRKS